MLIPITCLVGWTGLWGEGERPAAQDVTLGTRDKNNVIFILTFWRPI